MKKMRFTAFTNYEKITIKRSMLDRKHVAEKILDEYDEYTELKQFLSELKTMKDVISRLINEINESD